MAYSNDPKIDDLIKNLSDILPQDAKTAAEDKARFLAQAREIAPSVSNQVKQRHTGWNKNLLERISSFMKPHSKLYALFGSLAVLLVIVVFVATDFTTVSAQQIVDRAVIAQSNAAQNKGIWHTTIEILDNPDVLPGDQAGTKTVDETYADLATGYYRSITSDANGKILSASSIDGSFAYDLEQAGSGSSNSPLIVNRTPLIPDNSGKTHYGYVDASTTAVFDQFKNNPKVKLESTIPWTNGEKAYVLVLKNYQTQKGTDGKEVQTYMGATRMTFNTKTYQLLESQTAIHKGDVDIILSDVKFVVDEVLPAGSPVAWDLSDLKGVTYADKTNVPEDTNEDTNPTVETISAAELSAHTQSYLLKTIPEGYQQEIVALSNHQPYQYEIHYTQQGKTVFGMQFVGELTSEFIETSFYNGSYKSSTGLVLLFSPSGSSAILATPEGFNYLIDYSLPLDQVEALVDDLVLTK